MSLIDEATARLTDYSHWSPEANADLIRRMRDRLKELEPKARAWDSWQANSKGVA